MWFQNELFPMIYKATAKGILLKIPTSNCECHQIDICLRNLLPSLVHFYFYNISTFVLYTGISLHLPALLLFWVIQGKWKICNIWIELAMFMWIWYTKCSSFSNSHMNIYKPHSSAWIVYSWIFFQFPKRGGILHLAFSLLLPCHV